MAWRMRVKLPSFKVTQRCSTSTTRCNYPRGKSIVKESQEGGMEDTVQPEEDLSYKPDDHRDTSTDFAAEGLPSLHSISQKAAVVAWGQVRSALLDAVIESNAMPADNPFCIKCSEAANYRCLQCAPWAYYCHQCYINSHTVINLFHVGEVWEVRRYNTIVYQGWRSRGIWSNCSPKDIST